MKNLLRVPMVMGVPLNGLLALAFLVLTAMVLTGGLRHGNGISLALGVGGYLVLRVCARWMTPGWDDELLYPIEKRLSKSSISISKARTCEEIEVVSPETLEQTDLILEKEKVCELITDLSAEEDLLFEFDLGIDGVLGKIVDRPPSTDHSLSHMIYSLTELPVSTDPLFLPNLLDRLQRPFKVFIRISGISYADAKRKVEASRKRSARLGSGLLDIDSEVTFEEASRVLELMSRGVESICRFSCVISSPEHQPAIDLQYFKLEKSRELASRSIFGLRKKHFREHFVRQVTASDLVPNLLDPKECSVPILKTTKGYPVYFSPQDSRLEALHWLVVGATGTGKSFLTGCILKRMVEAGTHMSVLFVDHNRSFRRLAKHSGNHYFEPQTLIDFSDSIQSCFSILNQTGAISGIELSDLTLEDKKVAAKILLSEFEAFLRTRDTLHPVYLVLDECWNFIRDEPVLVQRAFREFRKLNGAVVAITQSLSDFLSDPSGRSIIQNTPIRILLRQGEDLGPYRGVLGLNDVETAKLRLLKQRKGSFSECLVKTPFLSRLGRLYPTVEEHDLLRTDNIREEMIKLTRMGAGVDGHA